MMKAASLVKSLLVLAVSAAAMSAVFADVRPAGIFNRNMVLQRDVEMPVWGWADPGEKVEVSFAGQTKNATADAHGAWEIRLAPLALNKSGETMTIKGNNTVELTNILVGDVWLCAGQSNMEMNFNWGIMDGEKFIAEAKNYPQIRRIKIRIRSSPIPLKAAEATDWSVCSSQTVSTYTAAGYFFARKLTQELDSLPIGILEENWGGRHIELFIALEGLQMVPEFAARASKVLGNVPGTKEWKASREKYLAELKAVLPEVEKRLAEGREFSDIIPKIEISNDSAIYNAMIEPIVRFPVKGVIWYQGCSNANDKGDLYFKYMQALVGGWRKVWNKPDMPFYFMQLASFQKPTSNPAGGDGFAWIREMQRKSLSIPNTGMACAIDIGEIFDIHPKNKIDAGERLALWALTKTYGKKDVVCSGPLYKGMKIEGNRIRLSFDYADGLMTAVKKGYENPVPAPGQKPTNFTVCGKDGKWFWADAVIEGNDVLVSSNDVAEPVAVRYAYRGFPSDLNMYNAAGLPMVPFRTDDPAPQETK